MNKLVVFTKYPTPGKAKTRMIPALGEEGAAALHKKLTLHTLETVSQFSKKENIDIEISFYGSDLKQMQKWLGDGHRYTKQIEGDLGAKMNHVFVRGFEDGYDKILVIGTDCPELSIKDLICGYKKLEQADLVLGPAYDGGYYCIGLKAPTSKVFDSIEWGSDRVFEQTMVKATNLGLKAGLLDKHHDIDRPDDLKVWNTITNSQFQKEKISVIIPTINEAENIGTTLRSFKNIQNIEIIVVDGGSTDRTTEIAENEGVEKVLYEHHGKGLQMNRGASMAEGGILLFLHADTRLPDKWDDCVRETLQNTRTIAGAFQLTIDGNGIGLRIIEIFTRFRSALLQLPYGDQGIFLRKDLFEQLGGFKPISIMEDFEFIRRAGKMGKIVTCKQSVITSGRRWQKFGIFRTTLINQLIVLGFYLGIPHNYLRKFYKQKKNRGGC